MAYSCCIAVFSYDDALLSNICDLLGHGICTEGCVPGGGAVPAEAVARARFEQGGIKWRRQPATATFEGQAQPVPPMPRPRLEESDPEIRGGRPNVQSFAMQHKCSVVPFEILGVDNGRDHGNIIAAFCLFDLVIVACADTVSQDDVHFLTPAMHPLLARPDGMSFPATLFVLSSPKPVRHDAARTSLPLLLEGQKKWLLDDIVPAARASFPGRPDAVFRACVAEDVADTVRPMLCERAAQLDTEPSPIRGKISHVVQRCRYLGNVVQQLVDAVPIHPPSAELHLQASLALAAERQLAKWQPYMEQLLAARPCPAELVLKHCNSLRSHPFACYGQLREALDLWESSAHAVLLQERLSQIGEQERAVRSAVAVMAAHTLDCRHTCREEDHLVCGLKVLKSFALEPTFALDAIQRVQQASYVLQDAILLSQQLTCLQRCDIVAALTREFTGALQPNGRAELTASMLEIIRTSIAARYDMDAADVEDLVAEFLSAVEHVIEPVNVPPPMQRGPRRRRKGFWSSILPSVLGVLTSAVIGVAAPVLLEGIGISGMAKAAVTGSLASLGSSAATGQKGNALLQSAARGALLGLGGHVVGDVFDGADNATRLIVKPVAHSAVGIAANVISSGGRARITLAGAIQGAVADVFASLHDDIGLPSMVCSGGAAAVVAAVAREDIAQAFTNGMIVDIVNHQAHALASGAFKLFSAGEGMNGGDSATDDRSGGDGHEFASGQSEEGSVACKATEWSLIETEDGARMLELSTEHGSAVFTSSSTGDHLLEVLVTTALDVQAGIAEGLLGFVIDSANGIVQTGRLVGQGTFKYFELLTQEPAAIVPEAKEDLKRAGDAISDVLDQGLGWPEACQLVADSSVPLRQQVKSVTRALAETASLLVPLSKASKLGTLTKVTKPGVSASVSGSAKQAASATLKGASTEATSIAAASGRRAAASTPGSLATSELANSSSNMSAGRFRFQPWRPGEPPTKLTVRGHHPSWTTVRRRQWINQAREIDAMTPAQRIAHQGMFPQPMLTEANLQRMRSGRAPLDAASHPLEFSHVFRPQRLAKPQGKPGRQQLRIDEPDNLTPVTREAHAAHDPHRHLGSAKGFEKS